ncbi:hypothetical protein ACFC0M_21790 [Streptomyces sp. NPDC056149]|uniref:hypothetical protein n=1 Tax=Streptomyces sp. NPDC056149 TaxID=3345728 RepID=UPI0035E030BF
MDLDTVVNELYALPPGEFTPARDARARAARAAGDRGLAERIRQLRRPTHAAWASNLLARDRGADTARLLRLGEELRQAHRELDGRRLRELAGRQHEMVAALTGQARHLAARAGHCLGANAQRELEDTLRAVLADQESAHEWARGRLTQPLTAVGLVTVPALTPATQAPDHAPMPLTDKVVDLDMARSRRRRRETRAEKDRPRSGPDAADTADAQRELCAAEAELASARGRERRALDRLGDAQQRVLEIGRKLAEAEDDLRLARQAVGATTDHVHQAEDAEREIRQRTAVSTAAKRPTAPAPPPPKH